VSFILNFIKQREILDSINSLQLNFGSFYSFFHNNPIDYSIQYVKPTDAYEFIFIKEKLMV